MVKKATEEILPFSPEAMGRLAADIASSPLSDEQKALYLSQIFLGSFDLGLYEELLRDFSAAKHQLQAEISDLESQRSGLVQADVSTQGEFRQAVQGMVQEIQQFTDAVEDKAMRDMEALREAKDQSDISALNTRLST